MSVEPDREDENPPGFWAAQTVPAPQAAPVPPTAGSKALLHRMHDRHSKAAVFSLTFLGAVAVAVPVLDSYVDPGSDLAAGLRAPFAALGGDAPLAPAELPAAAPDAPPVVVQSVQSADVGTQTQGVVSYPRAAVVAPPAEPTAAPLGVPADTPQVVVSTEPPAPSSPPVVPEDRTTEFDEAAAGSGWAQAARAQAEIDERRARIVEEISSRNTSAPPIDDPAPVDPNPIGSDSGDTGLESAGDTGADLDAPPESFPRSSAPLPS